MPNPSHDTKQRDITEYHMIEINEVFTRTRTLTGIRFQLFSFIGTAHLTIVGITFTVQKAILIFLAASLMVLLIKIDFVIESLIESMVVRGLQLEMMYSDDEESLWVSIISAVSSKRIEPSLIKRNLREAKTQAEILRRIKSRSTKQLGMWLPISVIILDCVAGSLLWGLGVFPLW